ncbi:heme peroxidase [Hygrophoropsis aurantiaca]|uniref:Heme peroxidase n=1 Tax=Hygrophoropsis aurantiaca TaxID=72124 RepID=A0ACB8A3T4_9AGAM|nr:heme peroxidase [Hygrophoropsis aurantiaca]
MSCSALRRLTTTTRSAIRVRNRPSVRGFSTTPPPSPKSSKTGLYAGLGAAALGGAAYAYYVYASQSDHAREAGSAVRGAAQAAKAAVNYTPTKADYQKVYNRIAEIMDDAGEYDDGSYGPVLLRLAWHASGTYDKATNTGGSNYATMRFDPEALHAANAGLAVARGLMDQVKREFPWISYGDLWTLGGVAAVQEMGGPKIPWRPGRIDGYARDATPDGRLPDAAQGAGHVKEIFARMGFTDQEAVALCGAHALGRCHRDRSGYDGPWTFSPTTFTNDYYTLLFDESWVWKKWGGPKQLEDKKTRSLMMLPTDYVLTQDTHFKKHAKAYAADSALFFRDFSAAFARLLELGVPFAAAEPWEMRSLDEQK